MSLHQRSAPASLHTTSMKRQNFATIIAEMDEEDDDSEFDSEDEYDPMQQVTEECCCQCGSVEFCTSFKRWNFIIIMLSLFAFLLGYLIPVFLVLLMAGAAQTFCGNGNCLDCCFKQRVVGTHI